VKIGRTSVSAHDSYLKAFGHNLRRIRKEQNFTLEHMSLESGLDSRQIGRIERGEVNTTILSVFRLSEVLKIDMYYLFLMHT
jgi:transcriptional regulator with XRE-family HTH domain